LIFQLSLEAILPPLPLYRSIVGSGRAPATANEGPMPRTMISPAPELPGPEIKPAIMTLSPLSTKPRVLMLASSAAAGWSRSYASINPIPSPEFFPLTMAV
jgi:hypothetical protein